MSRSPIPFILVGDAPTQPSGLGRIARDLCSQIFSTFGDRLRLLQLGLQHADGAYAWSGPWPLVTFFQIEGIRHGAPTLEKVMNRFERPGIVFAVWDAGFSYDLLRCCQKRGWTFWSYPAVDAVNKDGVIGGPAGDVIKEADRVVAYTRWSANALSKIRGEIVPHLYHGIGSIWQPAEQRAADNVVGCVATNHERKDLALYCETLAILRDRGHDFDAWLVTDTLVRGWSIPELKILYNLYDRTPRDHEQLKVFTNKDRLTDQQMVQLYQRSSVTIAPGLGEGFGYPIVESLACDIPVVHGGSGGAVELLPDHWPIPMAEAWRTEGIYALRRPVYQADHFADAVEARWADPQPGRSTQHVEHLRWDVLWPREWGPWITAGLDRFETENPHE